MMSSSFTMLASGYAGRNQAGRKLFAEDFAEVFLHFAFERRDESSWNLAAHAFDRRGREVARGIAGASGDGDKRVLRVRNLQQRLNPARGDWRRQHLIDRTVEQLARTDAGHAPERGLDHFAAFDHADQRV